jgi:hypothetical protein
MDMVCLRYISIYTLHKGDDDDDDDDGDVNNNNNNNNNSNRHEVKELQKTAILGTAHILWKVLM